MSFTSFEDAEQIVDRFIEALHRIGITPAIGSLVESELLAPLQLLEATRNLRGTTLPGARITLKDGVVQQSNWHDYRIPTHAHVPPRVSVNIVPSADAPTGVGEPSVPPLAPALANAIAALSGKRYRSLPFAA